MVARFGERCPGFAPQLGQHGTQAVALVLPASTASGEVSCRMSASAGR